MTLPRRVPVTFLIAVVISLTSGCGSTSPFGKGLNTEPSAGQWGSAIAQTVAPILAADFAFGTKITFDSVKLEKSQKSRGDNGYNALVTGVLTWHGARAKTSGKFIPIPNQYAQVHLLDVGGSDLGTLNGSLTVWDGDDVVTALPLDKPLHFAIQLQVSANILKATKKVKIDTMNP